MDAGVHLQILGWDRVWQQKVFEISTVDWDYLAINYGVVRVGFPPIVLAGKTFTATPVSLIPSTTTNFSAKSSRRAAGSWWEGQQSWAPTKVITAPLSWLNRDTAVLLCLLQETHDLSEPLL